MNGVLRWDNVYIVFYPYYNVLKGQEKKQNLIKMVKSKEQNLKQNLQTCLKKNNKI